MCTVAGRHPSAGRVDEFDSPEACAYRDTIWRLAPSLCGAQLPTAQTVRRSGEISWKQCVHCTMAGSARFFSAKFFSAEFFSALSGLALAKDKCLVVIG
jgi:hypothetical protein